MTVSLFATTREQRERELANLARWEHDQLVAAVFRRLERSLADSSRFALSQSASPGQKAGDRYWHRLLVEGHLAACVANLDAAGVPTTTPKGADQ